MYHYKRINTGASDVKLAHHVPAWDGFLARVRTHVPLQLVGGILRSENLATDMALTMISAARAAGDVALCMLLQTIATMRSTSTVRTSYMCMAAYKPLIQYTQSCLYQ